MLTLCPILITSNKTWHLILETDNFLKLLDFTPEEIHFLLDLSFSLKKAKYTGTETAESERKKYCPDF